MIETLLNPIMSPLLKLHPFLAVIIITFVTTLMVTLIYMWMTDQKLMKHLKDELKRYQDDMRKHGSNTKKLLEIQKKALDVNMKYLMASLKPTLVTFIPIIIVFAWVNAAMAYQPVHTAEEFTTTIEFQKGIKGIVEITTPKGIELLSPKNLSVNYDTQKAYSWKMKSAEEGQYLLEYKVTRDMQGVGAEMNYKKDVLVSNEQTITAPIKYVGDNVVKQVKIDQKPLIIVSIFGLNLNWLWTYVILSIIFSLALRKIMNVY